MRRINKSPSERRKFTKREMITVKGMISLGKYIFLIKEAFSAIELTEYKSDVLKKVHGKMPHNTKTGYFSTWIRKRREKTAVKRIIKSKGSKRAQKTPNIDLLYRTLRSRTTKFLMSSLYAKISLIVWRRRRLCFKLSIPLKKLWQSQVLIIYTSSVPSVIYVGYIIMRFISNKLYGLIKERLALSLILSCDIFG